MPPFLGCLLVGTASVGSNMFYSPRWMQFIREIECFAKQRGEYREPPKLTRNKKEEMEVQLAGKDTCQFDQLSEDVALHLPKTTTSPAVRCSTGICASTGYVSPLPFRSAKKLRLDSLQALARFTLPFFPLFLVCCSRNSLERNNSRSCSKPAF